MRIYICGIYLHMALANANGSAWALTAFVCHCSTWGLLTHTQPPPVNARDARRIKLDFYGHRYYID